MSDGALEEKRVEVLIFCGSGCGLGLLALLEGLAAFATLVVEDLSAEATIPDYHCIWSTPSGEEATQHLSGPRSAALRCRPSLLQVKFAAFHHAVNTRDRAVCLQRLALVWLGRLDVISALEDKPQLLRAVRQQAGCHQI